VKAGLEKDRAATLVVLAALRDGQKVILAFESGYRESTEGWATILRDLKRRGWPAPRLVIGDGHLGIWGALGAVFPEAKEQRCWNHRLLNILDKLPLKRQAEARTAAAKRFKKVETRRRSSGRRCSSRRRRSGGSTHPSCWPTSPTTSSTSTACVR